MDAAEEGRTNLVEELLQKGADVDAQDEVRYLRGSTECGVGERKCVGSRKAMQ